MKTIYMLAVVALATLAISCTKIEERIVEVERVVVVDGSFDPDKGILKLSFDHKAGSDNFQRGTSFTDANGNTYRFDAIRYWVSNIELTKDNGEVVKIEDGYYLIENRDSLRYAGTTAAAAPSMVAPPRVRESFTVSNIPVGNYTKIKFAIGIDPKYNNNFAIKAGELDITQMAMSASWFWKTSYIFARSQGTYLAAGGDPLADTHRFVVETGGNEAYRTVALNLGTALVSAPSKVAEVKLNVNVLGLFGGDMPAVPAFTGTTPRNWTADPNLTPYNKFVNAGSADDMLKLADNIQNAVFTLNEVVQ